jgi:hypothetical protein
MPPPLKRTTRLYYQYKARGLCHQCGKPSRPGKTLCQPCADKASAAHRAWYAAHKKEVQARYRARREAKWRAAGANRLGCCGVFQALTEPAQPCVICGRALTLFRTKETGHAVE